MALTQAQLRTAQLIMGLARQKGLSPARARELAAAAYAESGLDPGAVNKSSGAAGLFQLLSSGYRTKAQSLGGLHNPRANTLAILPNYVSYWRSHPNAAPGEAGRDVEISGQGAGFYSKPLGLLGGVAPGAVGGGAGPLSPVAAPGAGVNIASVIRNKILESYRQGREVDPMSLIRTMRQTARERPMLTPAAHTEAQATVKDSGGWVDPATGKVIGTPGAGTHTLGDWASDRALDISVPIGTPIRAPFAGTIGSQFGSLGASSGSRFAGLRLHVASPQNEWYGAHLSRFAPGIKPGVRVRPGQVVGYSGSAAGVPHLHEALRYGDPYRLIR